MAESTAQRHSLFIVHVGTRGVVGGAGKGVLSPTVAYSFKMLVEMVLA